MRETTILIFIYLNDCEVKHNAFYLEKRKIKVEESITRNTRVYDALDINALIATCNSSLRCIDDYELDSDCAALRRDIDVGGQE